MQSTNFEYVEFGKIHNEQDSSDFVILDYSSEAVKSLAGPLCVQFSQWLKLPEADRASIFSKFGTLSACLVSVPGVEFLLFCQIQSRNEGEYARFLENPPRVNRPYVQIRYIWIDPQKKEEIISAFAVAQTPYSSFFEEKPQHKTWREKPYALKNYTVSGSENALSVEIKDIAKSDARLVEKADQIVEFLLSTSRRDDSVPGENVGAWKARVTDDELSWLEKLKVIEIVQTKLWVLAGLFTFALDYVSDLSNLLIKFYPQEQDEYQETNRRLLELDNTSEGPLNSVQVLELYIKAVWELAKKDPERCNMVVEDVSRFFKYNFTLLQSIRLVEQYYGEGDFAEIDLQNENIRISDETLLLSAIWEFYKNDTEKFLTMLSRFVKNNLITQEKSIEFLIDEDVNKEQKNVLQLLCVYLQNNNIKISELAIGSRIKAYFHSLNNEHLIFVLKEFLKDPLLDNLNFIVLSLLESKRDELLEKLLPEKGTLENANLFYHLVKDSRNFSSEFIKNNWDGFFEYAIKNIEFLDWFFEYLLKNDFERAARFHYQYLRRYSGQRKHQNSLLDLTSPELEELFSFYKTLSNDRNREEKFWKIVQNFSAAEEFKDKWIKFLLEKYQQ
jgi:hypothetical protein